MARQPAWGQQQHIESDLVVPVSRMAPDPLLGCTCQAIGLPERDGGLRLLNRRSPLHLYKRKPPATHRNQIDLAELRPVTPRQDLVSIEAKKSRRDQLCDTAAPFALPSDAGRV